MKLTRVGIPSRAVGTVTRAGVFNTYKGKALTLWRQFNEATHNGSRATAR